jgi:pimeloyl-ACP methyl ester carboxylesterase/tetratricopeptide (TPR) repeat protein
VNDLAAPPPFKPIRVVFVHGLLSDGSVWNRFVDLMAADEDLAGFTTVSVFTYSTPVVQLMPTRRIPEIDDIADRLGTYLETEVEEADSIVLVTHSQGGLIAQRFLVRTLHRQEGLKLTRIKGVTMYACPNSGSQFLLSLRKKAFLWRNPQERGLRPFDRLVVETCQAVDRLVLNAQENTKSECAIPLLSVVGIEDNVVRPVEAASNFRTMHADGDHFSVVRPSTANASSYRILKAELIATARSGVTPVKTGDGERRTPVLVDPPLQQCKEFRLQGRTELINSILHDSRARVHVLTGLGGSGKSRVALEVAYREIAKRQVWWVHVTRINAGMRAVASRLGASVTEIDSAFISIERASDLVWRHLNNTEAPWLLVFDNADDPEVLFGPGKHVPDDTGWFRRPLTANGTVLVTSRDGNVATWGDNCRVHSVPPLSDSDGAYLLMNRAGAEAGGYEQARRLSAVLGGLPLALRIAADYVKSQVKNQVWSGEDIVNDFDGFSRYVQRRFELPPGELRDNLTEPHWQELLRSVCDISLELLSRRGLSQAAPLLKVFACMGIEPIPYQLLLNSDAVAESGMLTGLTEGRWHGVLTGLADLGLIDTTELAESPERGLAHVLTLHPVVHGLLRADPDVRERPEEYYRLIVRMLLNFTSGRDPDLPESWPRWNAIAPHAIEVCRASLLSSQPVEDRGAAGLVLELTRQTVRFLIRVGLLAPAHEIVDKVVKGCSAFGFDVGDRAILGIRHEQGRIELAKGQPEVAERLLRRVVDERTALLGPDDADTLASRHKYARAIFDQNRWKEAAPLLSSIVDAEYSVRGAEHNDTLVVRHTLAHTLSALGKKTEAETILREILTVRHRKWSRANPETLLVRATLATNLLEQNRVDEAEEEVRAALKDASARPDAPEALWLRSVLSNVLLLRGEVELAVTLLEQLLTDQREVLGVRHPFTLRTEAKLVEIRKIADDHS